jgi:hypothetical protein
MSWQLKPSERISLESTVWGAIPAGLFYYFWPYAVWWACLVAGLIVAGAFYRVGLEMAARQAGAGHAALQSSSGASRGHQIGSREPPRRHLFRL